MRSGVVRGSRVVVLIAAVIGAYCWFAADLRPFTIPIDVAVAVPSVVVATMTWNRTGSRSSMPADTKATRRRAAAPWAVLFGLLAVFEGRGLSLLSPARPPDAELDG